MISFLPIKMGLRDFREIDRTPALILAQMQELASSRNTINVVGKQDSMKCNGKK